MSNKIFENSLNDYESIQQNIKDSGDSSQSEEIIDDKKIITIGEDITNGNIEYYITNSKLIIEYILLQNAKNELNENNIFQLFKLANMYKDNGNYEKANEIFCILLDFSIHNPCSGINITYETDNCYDEIFESDYNYYYDLAVLIFKGQYINIPIPILSKKAVKIFFNIGVEVIDRKEHNRSVLENTKNIKKINKKYKKMNLNEAPWLLEDNKDSHMYIKDLVLKK